MDISVITPFYKGNSYMSQLFSCIARAALAVPEARIELILVNDSPECPVIYEEDWVRGFALRVLENSVNSGIHQTRVNGLTQARGEFIWFLDQDDLLSQNAFSSMLSMAADADVIVGNGFDQNPHSYGPIYKTHRHQQQAAQPRFYYSVGNQIVSPGHCLIRRSVIPAGWQENIVRRNGSDDLLLWLLLFHSGCRWKINPEQLYTHVDTGANVSANVAKMADSSMEVLAILQKLRAITPSQTRRFLRSRALAAAAGKGAGRKLLAMLRYPDVALEKLRLRKYRQEGKS